MATSNADRRPRLLEGIDLRELPLTPGDAFVLSRVDGSSDEEDIAMATGLDIAAVRATLEKLARLGVLGWTAQTTPVPPKRESRPRTMSGSFRVGPIVETHSPSSGNHPAAALYDPRELDEAVEVAPEVKRKVLDTFYRLDQLSHYELLGIDAQANKRAIKAAYFELVNLFHPDRYFGRNLGSFKPKLERLFAQVTEAHDTLTRTDAREEYDRYLASVRRTRELDDTLADQGAHANVVAKLEREIAAQADLEQHAQHSYPPPTPTSVPPRSSQPVVQTASFRPSDPDARRRALARKLGVSAPPGPRVSFAPPDPEVTVAARAAATAEIKRRYEQRIAELKEGQVQRFVEAGADAERSGDLVSATNALRIATSLAPGDVALRRRLAELESRAAAGLADGYIEQAQYEERGGRYAEAARSYRRALRGRSSPKIMERLATCLLLAKADLREAAEYGRSAVQAAPEDATFRVTLAKIYLEAGMKQSAAAELERAQQLSPKDDSIRDLLKRARRLD